MFVKIWLLGISLSVISTTNVFTTTESNDTSDNDDDEPTNYSTNSSTSELERQSNETMGNKFVEEIMSNFTEVLFNGTVNVTNNHLNGTNGTEVRNETEPATTDDDTNNIFGSLSALKQLISKTYWEQRMNDPYYLSEAFVPFCAGILVSWLLIVVFCTLKCCCARKNKRNKLLRIKTIKNDTKKDGSQWMLLEKNSSDEEI